MIHHFAGCMRRAIVIGAMGILGAGAPAVAQSIPASTTLAVRTLDALESTPAARGRKVRAMVMSPVVQDERVVVAPRTILEGAVVGAGVEPANGRRHFLDVRFTSMLSGDGSRLPVAAQVIRVDNARDTVDEHGRILGPSEPSKTRDRADWAALALGTASPVAAAIFFAALWGEAHERHRRISYPAGTDMTLFVEGPVQLPAWPLYAAPPPIDGDSSLGRLLATLPTRSFATGDRVPKDFVNLLFIGNDMQVNRAFERAGWTAPDRMSTAADFETFIRAARGQGFMHQPVSRQVMFGRPPDLVFQRVANTFAKRHHVRLWRTTERWDGLPVWVAAATHDVGVEISLRSRTFTHRVDDAIDGERDKVVSDLSAALQVGQLSSVARMPLPDSAGRGPVLSDWRVAVIRVREAP